VAKPRGREGEMSSSGGWNGATRPSAASRRPPKLAPTIPVSQTQAGTAAARWSTNGLGATPDSACGAATSTATEAVSALPAHPLNEGLPAAVCGPLSWDEQLAVRALEAAVAPGRTWQQLARERLLAVRADDVALAP